ncbi:MAG TPA: ribosome biogenesis factor YjgA [Gammaproteobacteria bacterium]|nr:ribosome biogenesis factor YjgA [Gammaproteobacteria bacterium]
MESAPKQSKSQVKRDLRALQLLGCELVELPEKNLARLPLSEALFDAVRDARPMNRRARQRQLRYIGALLPREDVDAIRRALREELRPAQETVARFHEIERWREELLTGGDEAVEAFLLRRPDTDRQRLRRLVGEARAERQENNGQPKSARLLFKYLRDL